MWNNKSCIERPSHQSNRENNRLIESVQEEARYDEIIDDVFLGSSSENPYQKKVTSSVELCSEIKEQERQRFLREKRSQQLRESNQELKLLEVQLRAAYVRKAINAQIFENKMLKQTLKDKNHIDTTVLTQARLQGAEADKKLEEEKQAKRAKLKQDLLDQIATTNAKRLIKYEHILQEKKNMDDMMRKFKEEKQKEDVEAAEKKMKAKIDLNESIRANEQRKITQAQKNDKEQEDIKEFYRQRELELQLAEQAKKERLLRKQQISEQLGQQNYAFAEEQAKNRDYLVELLVDERQAKEEMQMRKNLEHRLSDSIAIRLQIASDIEEKRRLKLEQKRLDEKLFQEEMCILAERDKLQQLSDEKRRRKQMEHRRSLQEALDEKKRIRAEQMKHFLRAKDQEAMETERNNQLVEEERGRILKEHASGLVGFLARGVLRESDRKYISIPSTHPKQN